MMQRWNVLILLFIVRLSMAAQFQSVASMSPAIMKEYGVGLGDIGLLISLYLAPALPLHYRAEKSDAALATNRSSSSASP
jgi:hypothetical protein